jgi:hypothetical protein
MTKRSKKVSVARLTTAEKWAREGKITPEMARHIGQNAEEREMGEAGKASSATVLQLRMSPVERMYHKHKLLTEEEYAAAQKLRADFDRSGLDTLKACDWTREVVDGGAHKAEPIFVEEARRAVLNALAAVSVKGKNLVIDVVIREKEVADANSFFTTPDRAHQATGNRVLLRAELQRLVDHYRNGK